jgi:hypothetical protein
LSAKLIIVFHKTLSIIILSLFFGYTIYEKCKNNYTDTLFVIQSRQEQLDFSDILQNSALLILEKGTYNISRIISLNEEYSSQHLVVGLKQFQKGYIHSKFEKLEYIYSEISTGEILISITSKKHFINKVLYQQKIFIIVCFFCFLCISILMGIFTHHPYINKKYDLLLIMMYNVFITRNLSTYFISGSKFFGWFLFSFEFWILFLYIILGYLFFVKIALPRYMILIIISFSFVTRVINLVSITMTEGSTQLKNILYCLFLFLLLSFLVYKTYYIFHHGTVLNSHR